MPGRIGGMAHSRATSAATCTAAASASRRTCPSRSASDASRPGSHPPRSPSGHASPSAETASARARTGLLMSSTLPLMRHHVGETILTLIRIISVDNSLRNRFHCRRQVLPPRPGATGPRDRSPRPPSPRPASPRPASPRPPSRRRPRRSSGAAAVASSRGVPAATAGIGLSITGMALPTSSSILARYFSSEGRQRVMDRPVRPARIRSGARAVGAAAEDLQRVADVGEAVLGGDGVVTLDR